MIEEGLNLGDCNLDNYVYFSGGNREIVYAVNVYRIKQKYALAETMTPGELLAAYDGDRGTHFRQFATVFYPGRLADIRSKCIDFVRCGYEIADHHDYCRYMEIKDREECR